MSSKDKKKLLSTERDLINSIKTFVMKLESVQINKDLIEQFLSSCDNFIKLPSKCDVDIVDSFLVNLVSIISINTESESSFKALELLFTYLKNDPQVY